MIKRMIKDKRMRFLITGVINTTFSFVVYAYLVTQGNHYTVATAISFVLTVMLSYFLNKYFTFQEKKRSSREVIRFVTVYLISYIINVQMLWILCDFLQVDKIYAQIICTPVITVISYIGHNKFSFSGQKNV